MIKSYGDSTVVFIQNGNFYAAMCRDDEGPNVKLISKISRLTVSRLTVSPKTLNHPITITGFPIKSFEKYKDILCEIADSNLLADILSEISGTKVIIEKSIEGLSDYMRDAEYHLS